LAGYGVRRPAYAHQHLLAYGYVPALGIAVPWTVHVLSLHVIWSICTPIALVECMVPDRRTTPWLRPCGLVAVAVLYGLGVAATVVVTQATYPYVAPTSRLVGAALAAAVLVLVGARLTARRPAPRPAPQPSPPAPAAWVVGIAAAVAASILVVAAHVPTAAGNTLTFLLTEAAAVAAIAVWSRRSGWSQRHVLALAAAALFAYAWHAFTSTPAFDTAPIAVVRVSNVVFAAMALAAVLLAARRLARGS
jgi:hypothetical protein